MASFKYYNIQLLPIGKAKKSHQKYIGQLGYQKIWSTIQSNTIESVKSKNLRLFSAKMRGDTAFTTRVVELSEKNTYAYGKFIKFDRAHDIFGTLVGEERYKAADDDASKRYEFSFVFDFEKHILAIENKKGLPSSYPLIQALDDFIGNVASSLFKEHILKVDELTLAESMENVFKENNTFNSVEVSVTFSNSEEWSDAISGEIERLESELKEKHIDERVLTEKSSRDSVMKELSNEAKVMVALASKYGNAKISYNSPNAETIVYHMAEYPVKQTVDKTFINPENPKAGRVNKSLEHLARDVWGTIAQANTLALASSVILKKIRANNE